MNATPNNSNPFSTRFVRPAMNEFLFGEGETLHQLLARFNQHGSWGQIIGPHGSGKTTLLHAVSQQLTEQGRTISWHELHDGQRQLPCTSADIASWQQGMVVIVDGYEQLSWLSRLRLKRTCKRLGCGLLITAHADMGLPLLHETHPTQELAQALVDRLMQGQSQGMPADQVAAQFEACNGDVREMLFRLYDVYEQQ